jgi:hypothetical protein
MHSYFVATPTQTLCFQQTNDDSDEVRKQTIHEPFESQRLDFPAVSLRQNLKSAAIRAVSHRCHHIAIPYRIRLVALPE